MITTTWRIFWMPSLGAGAVVVAATAAPLAAAAATATTATMTAACTHPLFGLLCTGLPSGRCRTGTGGRATPSRVHPSVVVHRARRPGGCAHTVRPPG